MANLKIKEKKIAKPKVYVRPTKDSALVYLYGRLLIKIFIAVPGKDNIERGFLTLCALLRAMGLYK